MLPLVAYTIAKYGQYYHNQLTARMGLPIITSQT